MCVTSCSRKFWPKNWFWSIWWTPYGSPSTRRHSPKKSRKFSKNSILGTSPGVIYAVNFTEAKMNVGFTDPSILLRWFSRTEYLCTFFLIFCLYAIRWDIKQRVRHSSCSKPFMNIQFWHVRTIDLPISCCHNNVDYWEKKSYLYYRQFVIE